MKVILLSSEPDCGNLIKKIKWYSFEKEKEYCIVEIEDDAHVLDNMIQWYDPKNEMSESRLEYFRMKIMKSSNLIEPFSLEKMKQLLDEYLQRQSSDHIESLIELAYEYPGVLLPEQRNEKEYIPSLHIMFNGVDIFHYKEDINVNGIRISIKQHDLMMELPIHVLKTLYGLPTKISQVYRALFPNTWAQAYFNFTTDIIIHPMYNDKMIVIIIFDYYYGYNNHPNTHTLLDNTNIVQLLKNNHTLLPLTNRYTLECPFPTIYGVNALFNVNDNNMDVKVGCYNPELDFGNEIELPKQTPWKIPGDTTFGFLEDKNAFDPHQYHYILRRISRALYEYPLETYECIMSDKDLPDEIMYFIFESL
jgi:hypothetical protein